MEFGADWSDEIDVFTKSAAIAPSDACSERQDMSVGYSASALVERVTKHPGPVVSAPQAITIGGHQGQWMDITVDPSVTKTCPDDPTSSIKLYKAIGSYDSKPSAGMDRARGID